MLTLTKAQKNGQLQEFALEQERLGVPSILAFALDKMVASAVKAPQPQDQTSSFRAHDGSTGK